MLLALLLFAALLSIGIMTSIERIDFQIKREREEEMIHRGVQYARAVQHFYKKFGRYPTRIEELESTNNMRFLRRRYKDPMNRDPKTGKERDFKLLRLGDVQMSFGGTAPGISVAQMAAQQQGAPGALNSNDQAPSGFGPSSIAGAQGSSPAGTPESGEGNTPGDASQNAGSDSGTPPPPQPLSQQMGPNGAPQVFGGGGIVGVVSLSKDKTIRVFNKKDHYNQWQFIYDPMSDRGGLLMTPNQPPLMLGAGQNQQTNGGNSGFGNGPMGAPGQNTPQVLTPNMPPDQ